MLNGKSVPFSDTRFAIEVKKAVLCKAMQLEECSVSREMILRYVSKTVRSILRKVLMMEVVPTAIKQELESQKLLEQGLGLELDTRSSLVINAFFYFSHLSVHSRYFEPFRYLQFVSIGTYGSPFRGYNVK